MEAVRLRSLGRRHLARADQTPALALAIDIVRMVLVAARGWGRVVKLVSRGRTRSRTGAPWRGSAWRLLALGLGCGDGYLVRRRSSRSYSTAILDIRGFWGVCEMSVK